LHCCSHTPILTLHPSTGFLLHILKQKSLFTAYIKLYWPISIPSWCHTPRWVEHKKFIHFPFHFCFCLHTPICLIYKWHHCLVGHMVAHFVEALHHKLEGHGFHSCGVNGIFHGHNPFGYRNYYQEDFLGAIGCRCVGLTTLPPACADCPEIWEPQTSGNLTACPQACQGLRYL
jgi:hypothetical protein